MRLEVKNGSDVSEARLAVKPIDWDDIREVVTRCLNQVGLTPFATRCLIILSNPTNAPLKMNKTLDVSIWYTSAFAGRSGEITIGPVKYDIRAAIFGARCPPLELGSRF